MLIVCNFDPKKYRFSIAFPLVILMFLGNIPIKCIAFIKVPVCPFFQAFYTTNISICIKEYANFIIGGAGTLLTALSQMHRTVSGGQDNCLMNNGRVDTALSQSLMQFKSKYTYFINKAPCSGA